MTQPLRFHLQVAPNSTQVRPASAAVGVQANPLARVIIAATEGPAGPAGSGGGGTVQLITSTALSGHRLVIPDDSGQLAYADATVLAHAARPIWLTTSAWGSGVLATVTSEGPVTEPTWNWTVGSPIYLGTNGAPVQTIPPGAAFVLVVAEVINPTTLAFRPGSPIITA